MAQHNEAELIPAELTHVTTEDGITHSGAVFRPTRFMREGDPVAIVWVHGGGQNFYYRSYLRIGRAVAAQGYPFLTVNTRGRDIAATVGWTTQGRLLRGSGWDLFGECVHDLAAWIGRVDSLGWPRVVLVGHSFSGWKVAYYQAHRQDGRVAGVVLASTPIRPPNMDDGYPQEVRALAEELVAAGRGDDSLPLSRSAPVGVPRSAASLVHLGALNLDLYGRYGGEPLLGRFCAPVLAWFGSQEPRVGGRANLEQVARLILGGRSIDTQVIDGATHMYDSREEAVAGALVQWVGVLP